MSLPSLATQDDLTAYGYSIPANADALLVRASARIRLAAGHQTITADTSTVTFPPDGRGCVTLWQVPVTGVHAVSRSDDGTAITDYVLIGNELFLPTWDVLTWQSLSIVPIQVTVTYTHGFATLPDELVELTCAVAVRLSGTRPDRDPAIQAQTVGDVSQTINPAALDVAGGLLPGEYATVRRIFYKRG